MQASTQSPFFKAVSSLVEPQPSLAASKSSMIPSTVPMPRTWCRTRSPPVKPLTVSALCARPPPMHSTRNQPSQCIRIMKSVMSWPNRARPSSAMRTRVTKVTEQVVHLRRDWEISGGVAGWSKDFQELKIM